MVRIAIVDSGIDYNKNVFKQFVVSGIRITRDKDGSIITDNKIYDENGHGTLSASVIYKECPEAFVYIIKIFEYNLETDLEILEAALEHILEIPIDIVNLSLAFPANYRSKRLNEICKQIHKQGKVIISSVFNGKDISQPASFKSVIGVRGMVLDKESTILFNSKKRTNCIIDSMKYLHYCGNNNYILYGECNSYAAAKFAGILAKRLNENKLIDIKILEKEIGHNHWSENKLLKMKRYPEFKNPNVHYNKIKLKKLEVILEQFFGIYETDKFHKYALWSDEIGGRTNFYYDLIKTLEVSLKVKLQYSSLSRYDFTSIYSLYTILENKL